MYVSDKNINHDSNCKNVITKLPGINFNNIHQFFLTMPVKGYDHLGSFTDWYVRAVFPVLSLVLFTLVAALVFFCNEAACDAEQKGGQPSPLVTVVKIIEQTVNPPVEYVGHMEAIQTVELRARVQGVLEQIKFKEGGDVNAGDLLFVIEQASYIARVNADKARVDHAAAVLTKTTQYLQRLKNVSSGGVSATDIDNAVAAKLMAHAELQKVKANLELSELNLKYTKVKAPISGRIGKTVFTKGNLVGPESGPLAKIVQLNPIRVVYSISENNLFSVKKAFKDSLAGKKKLILMPRIKLPDGKIFKTTGYIDFVDNTVDSETGTIAVRAVFDNSNGMLLPGQYVIVLVRPNNGAKLPMVPQAAVIEDHDGHYVLVVDRENKVIQRRIKTGLLVQTRWAVEAGLKAGEMVIVQGIQKVQPGQTVKTINN